jgi:hypothetical protein
MVNWEEEFKKYVVRKMKKVLGYEIQPSEITKLIVNTDVDLTTLIVQELATVYAFAIMREDFEYARKVADELETRDCEVKIEMDDVSKTGAINIYLKPKSEVVYIDIKMKLLPDGMMIDWEKQNF